MQKLKKKTFKRKNSQTELKKYDEKKIETCY